MIYPSRNLFSVKYTKKNVSRKVNHLLINKHYCLECTTDDTVYSVTMNNAYLIGEGGSFHYRYIQCI